MTSSTSSRSVGSTALRAAGAAVLAGAMVVTGNPVGETAVAAATPAVVHPGIPVDLPPGADIMPTGGWGHGGGHGNWGHGGWGQGKLGHGGPGHGGWVNGGRINGFIHSGGRGGW